MIVPDFSQSSKEKMLSLLPDLEQFSEGTLENLYKKRGGGEWLRASTRTEISLLKTDAQIYFIDAVHISDINYIRLLDSATAKVKSSLEMRQIGVQLIEAVDTVTAVINCI